METIKAIRLKNLRKLIDQSAIESERQFAFKCELSPSHLNQITREERGIGDAVARRIEKAFNMESGWLDQDHEIDNAFLLTDIQKGYEQLDEEGQSLVRALIKKLTK